MPERTCSIDACEGVHYGRGYCRLHYDRWKRHGDPERGPLTLEERFWQQVNRAAEDECWRWTGRTLRGYGVLNVGGRSDQSTVRAHRLAYELLVGPIPDGMVIDHLCHDSDPDCHGDDCPHRSCVNPAHMEVVTPEENQRRGHHGAARSAHIATITNCPHGHPYDDENTYVNRAGARMCRSCARRRAREAYWRKKNGGAR